MPLFLIRREVPGITQSEVDAAAYRAIACSFYYSGLRWFQSYWDQEAGTIHCIYEAESAEQLFEHSRVARVPCHEVREVVQFEPAAYVGADGQEVANA